MGKLLHECKDVQQFRTPGPYYSILEDEIQSIIHCSKKPER